MLVCTDCLSEGVNLQHWFDAVVHYDLSYNPTRHEQREGRVDRYGGRPRVRALTYYGRDNPIDGFMLQVLLRKQQKIIKMLGVHIPLPMNSGMIEDAFLEWLQLQQDTGTQQLDFEFVEPHRESVEIEWDQVAEREKKSRALFAQHRLQKDVNDELVSELAEVRRALGGTDDVRGFATRVLRANSAILTGHEPVQVDLRESPQPLREAIGHRQVLRAVFNGRPRRNVDVLTRTHPVVEGLASYVMETTLDRRGRNPSDASEYRALRCDPHRRRLGAHDSSSAANEVSHCESRPGRKGASPPRRRPAACRLSGQPESSRIGLSAMRSSR